MRINFICKKIDKEGNGLKEKNIIPNDKEKWKWQEGERVFPGMIAIKLGLKWNL